MALVAYDNNSDSSDFDEDDDSSPASTTLHKVEVPDPPVSKPVTASQPISKQNQNLFNLLPQPSSKKPVVIEEDDEILHKRASPPNIAKPKARITVPSLSDFKDIEDSVSNKPKTIAPKGSGLLSLLPQPRNRVFSTTTSKSLIPQVLTQKPSTSTVKKKTPLPSPMKPKPAKQSILDYSDDSDNEDEVQNDFFSIHKPVEIPIVDLPLEIDSKVAGSEKLNSAMKHSSLRETQSYQPFYKENGDENTGDLQPDLSMAEFGGESISSVDNVANGSGFVPVGASNELALDDEAIRQLCGSRGKRRREEIQLVDVNQQEVLGDSREWLLKGLMDDTTKRVSVKRGGHEPTSQQKRKHQITYLAHQAKANEAELQNQWANSRQSKRQTQSKYGF